MSVFTRLPALVAATVLIVTSQAARADGASAKGGAQYFVGAWQCHGTADLPGTPFHSKARAHLSAEAKGQWVIDHFQVEGPLGYRASETGYTDWDAPRKTLHRYAVDGHGHLIEWVNHGGWHRDHLQLEAKVKTWFGKETWVLDEFVRFDDNRFTHTTYVAKDSNHWQAFYTAQCERVGE